MPQISVIMATYNGAAYLREQLDSIAGQTVLPSEVLVADDGSTDGTRELLRLEANRGRLPLVVNDNPERLGAAASFARLLGAATGDIVLFSDQDDVWLPDRIDVTIRTLGEHPEAALFFSDAELIDGSGRPVHGSTLWAAACFGKDEQTRMATGQGWRVLLRRNVVTGATLAVRRSALDQVLPIRGTWLHDGWLAWRLGATRPCALSSRPLVRYRRHGQQQVGVVGSRIGERLAWARRNRSSTFLEEAANLRVLREVFEQSELQAGDEPSELLRVLDDKVAFLQRRAEATRRGLGRAPALLNAWRLGEYDRFALGWRSFAADLVARRG